MQPPIALLIPDFWRTGGVLRKRGRLTTELLLEHENAARHHGSLPQRLLALPASRASGVEGRGCLWSPQKEREEECRKLNTVSPGESRPSAEGAERGRRQPEVRVLLRRHASQALRIATRSRRKSTSGSPFPSTHDPG